jgi:hypothetical protein
VPPVARPCVSMSLPKLQTAVFFVEPGRFPCPSRGALGRLQSMWISYKVWPPVVALVPIFTLVNMVHVANLSALRGSCGSIPFRVEQAVETRIRHGPSS